jgi:DNA-binding MarR family transcriptional regulator
MYSGGVLTEPIRLPQDDGQPDDAATLRAMVADLVQMGGRLNRLARRASRDDTTAATWRTLAVLQSAGPMRLGELAVLTGVAQPTMTKIVAGLVERDRVKRIADDSDHRAWQIAISSKGILVLERWRAQIAEALAPAFEDLTSEQIAAIRDAIELINPRVSRGIRAADSLAGKVSD